MTTELVTSGWASTLLNHLWQSTAVVLLAWMLTILLHNNSARVRYAIWLFASIKFLLPFQLLTYAGAHWSQPVTSDSALFYAVVEEFTRPLRQAPIETAPATMPESSFHGANVIWALIAIVWFCGFVVLLMRWLSGWKSAFRIAADAEPTTDGREYLALLRAQ